MDQNSDPDLRKYFRKIIHSLFYGLLWMAAGITAGIYYKLAFFDSKPALYVVLFYIGLITTLAFLIRFYIKVWKS